MKLIFPRRPLAKARPRRSIHGGVFYPKRYQNEEKALMALALQQRAIKLLAPVHVDLVIHADGYELEYEPIDNYRPRSLRGDIDNYEKMILDSLTGTCWEDDKQIHSVKVQFNPLPLGEVL